MLLGPSLIWEEPRAEATRHSFQGPSIDSACREIEFPSPANFRQEGRRLARFRTTTYKLSFDEYLVWWEGEAFDVPIKFGSDKTYNERAPVFISTGNKPRIAPNEAKALEVDAAQQNAMMDKRLRYFHFAESLSLEDIVEVAPCASCFAAWVAELPGGATAAHSPAPAQSSGHAAARGAPAPKSPGRQ